MKHDERQSASSHIASVAVLLGAAAGGLFAGYVDLTATEVQGPALLLMAVAFLCAVPQQAPAWLVAVVTTSGLPVAHWLAQTAGIQGAAPNGGMIVALIPALLAAYIGVAFRYGLDAASDAIFADGVEAQRVSLERPLVVFAGLAACTALGIRPIRNVMYMRPGVHDNDWWIAAVWQLASLVVWAAIAIVIARRTQKRLQHPGGDVFRVRDLLRQTSVIVLGAAAHTIGVLLLAHLLFIPLLPGAIWGETSFLMQLNLFLTLLPLDALCFMTIVLLVYMTDRERIARENKRHSAELSAALDQSRLAALNAQLRPHFIFNALNSVVVLARRGDAAGADEAASTLATLMRYVLDSGADNDTVALRQEIAFVESYLDLERIRFPDRLTTEIVCDVDAADARVPRLLLQPAVENAVRHGISQKSEGGHITLNASVRAGKLDIVVADDGPGIRGGATVVPGLGMRATESRLSAIYGGAASMNVSPGSYGGTTVRFNLPLHVEPA